MARETNEQRREREAAEQEELARTYQARLVDVFEKQREQHLARETKEQRREREAAELAAEQEDLARKYQARLVDVFEAALAQ